MTKFLTAVVGKLPASVQPYAKAFVPFTLAAVVAIQDLTVTVAEVNELKVLAGGLVTSLLVAALPNLNYGSPGAN